MSDTITPTQVSELVDHYKQWTIGADHAGQVLPKSHFEDAPERSYNLKNKALRKFLQYENQNWGINLGWTDDASPETGKRVARWFFTRRTGSGPVTYGETIALANGHGESFLHYAERDRGINLNWSREPVFEWRLLGGKPGQPVERGRYLAIYNLKAALFFCYFDRNLGGDIGWSDSSRWEEQASDKIKSLLKEYGEDLVKKAVLAALAGGA